MPEALDVVKRAYDAFARHDGATLGGLLAPEFTAQVAPGMPYTVGGTRHGSEAGLREVWGTVARHYDIAPFPDDYLVGTEGTIVVTGYYRGTVRATGRPVEAEFAHLWRVRNDLIIWLHQYTDTVQWTDALNDA